MSAATTDPALVATQATDLSSVAAAAQAAAAAAQVAHVAQVVSIAPTIATPPKERHSLTLDQRRALRRWASAQSIRPSHKACIDWFYHEYGQQISQSTVSHSLSPKYARLDGEHPQLSGSRLRFGNWPDVEKLVLLWYQQIQAGGRAPTNEELGEKAKSIFAQLPRYKDESPPEFSPGWIHRFKKRYGLLVRRPRRTTEEGEEEFEVPMTNTEDMDYLVENVPRFMVISADMAPTLLRDEIHRVLGHQTSLRTCTLVRDEIMRRMSEAAPQHQQPPPQPQPEPQHHQPQDTVATESPMAAPPTDQPIYGEDDAEMVLQNALRHLQQEEAAAEQQAAAQRATIQQREEREQAERVAAIAPSIMTSPEERDSSVPRYTATPTQEIGQELTLTPINSEGPISDHERPLRCPFCVNQRMLRTIKEAVEHMSTHVVV